MPVVLGGWGGGGSLVSFYSFQQVRVVTAFFHHILGFTYMAVLFYTAYSET